MSNKDKETVLNENAVQAVIIADTFDDSFSPLTNDLPLALLPLMNKPLLDYTLEFLSLSGVEETFLFCCSHVNKIKEHIKKRIDEAVDWSLIMKVNILVSESCQSFGDCLRDLDAKALLRGDFILLEPGVVSNIKLLPILSKHSHISKMDKGAAMTLIYQKSGIGQLSKAAQEEVVIAANTKNRILFHEKVAKNRSKKLDFPLEIFLDHSPISILHNLKDTHIAVCSPSVLPLFSDNFDFQTKDDFVRGLLMNEEILGSTVYHHIISDSQYGGAVLNWPTFQTLSRDLKLNWVHPLGYSIRSNKLKNGSLIGQKTTLGEGLRISKSVIDSNVSIGKNVEISNSFVMSNCKIGNNVKIDLSIVGPNCTIKSNSKIVNSSVIGNGVVIENSSVIDHNLVQSTKPENHGEWVKLGEKAFRLKQPDVDDDVDNEILRHRLSEFKLEDDETSDENPFTDSEDEDLSYTQSPPPDDTKLFFTEVIDSLTRGYEDKLLCDNLILEINSSRYAYNVTLKEVNFNVVKSILIMSLKDSIGPQYFSQLARLLSYFSPILKNYVRNEDAMYDCLQAIEDASTTNEGIDKKWASFVLKWFYDKDFLSEDAILKWSKTLDQKHKFYAHVEPFIKWLEEAEETSSSDDN